MNDVTRFIVRRIPLMLVRCGCSSLYLPAGRADAVGPGTGRRRPYATEADIAAVAKRLGLTIRSGTLRRLLERHLPRIAGCLAVQHVEQVMAQIGQYLPSTLELIILSLIVGGVLGLLLGSISAYFHRRWPDRISSGSVSILQSLPDFLLGVVLIYIFAYKLGRPARAGGAAVDHRHPAACRHPHDARRQPIAGQWATFTRRCPACDPSGLTLGLSWPLCSPGSPARRSGRLSSLSRRASPALAAFPSTRSSGMRCSHPARRF